MRFGAPWWLAGGALGCLALGLLWYRYDRLRLAALRRFIAPHLGERLTRSVSGARRRIERGLSLGAFACLCTALAQPQVGFRWEQITHRGYDIVFAIDTSRSMSAQDVAPDRLSRAKLAIEDFAAGLDGDAVGIVAFAGQAFLVCPITLDYVAFRESLNALDTGTIARGGTNIPAAIGAAQAVLENRTTGDKVLILVTDGENLEGDALAAAREASHRDGLKIFTVGVGTAAGELIALPPGEGGGFLKDEAGTLVKSRLDEPALRAIAAATGARYAPLGSRGEGLQEIYRAVFGSTDQHDLASRRRKVYIDRYQWPLAVSFALLMASVLVGTRRRGTARAAVAVPALVLAMLLPAAVPRAARAAAPAPASGEAAGTAAYRSGEFRQAAQAFRLSIGGTPSNDARRLGEQQDSYYDLGNALYRIGQTTEKSDPSQTLQRWTEALTAYDTALQLRADDADSKYNRDFVQRKIDALRQQQNPRGGSGAPPPPAQGPAPPPPGGNARSPPGGRPPPGANAPRQGPPPDGSPAAAPPPPRSEMSAEEARQLLDSEKAEERHPLTLPTARRDPAEPPEKPYKNW